MCRQKYLVRNIRAFLAFCLIQSGIPLLQANPESAEAKGLFYYVVDRSGSITTNSLTEPIRSAITKHAARLPADTEVRLVFFSRRASESRRWEQMTAEAKQEFAKYFGDHFIPDGPTRLYDTVAEVMNEVRASSEDYRFVTVLVFSDGESNWTRSYRNWKQLEPVYENLTSRHEHSFIYWITLGFDPAEEPPPWVHHVPQPPGTTQIPIPEPAPGASFVAHPLQTKVGEPVQFQHEPGGGRVTAYHWDFGDGKTSAEENPLHQYENDGVYTVTLKTTGPGGEAEETKQDMISVAPVIPLVAAFRVYPDRIQIGGTIQLEDQSSGDPEAREWTVNGEVISTEPEPSFVAEAEGEIEVVLSVRRGEEVHTETQTLTVLPLPPPAEFEISPAEGKFGDTIQFQAKETRSEWKHTWTIDGEIVLEGPEVVWTAERDGLMRVAHTVEGPGGASRHTDRFFVHPAEKFVPVTGFTVEPKYFVQGDTVVFKAEAIYDGWSHEWLLGGEPAGQGPELEWQSDRSGNLVVTHRIYNSDTGESFQESNEILGRAPDLIHVEISATPVSGVYPLEVQFRDESKGDPVAYLWDFGDGTTSEVRNPVHTYEEAGEYTVTLTVTNARGAVTTSVEPIVLSIAAPMPMWAKVAIGVAAAVFLWIVLIVPFILRPMLAPQKGPKLVGIQTYPIHLRTRRGWGRFFWPKTSVTIGSTLHSDIRLPSDGVGRSNIATIERVPAAPAYNIRPTKKHEIFRIETRTSLTKAPEEVRTRVTRPRLLRDGDTYEIGGERLTWHQPKKPARPVSRKAKQLEKNKPIPGGKESLVKVRN